ncbi:MAG: AbrB/MazE/SpoVT family DNA-binding domain-containing protein [Promethearchaeota archaeon]
MKVSIDEKGRITIPQELRKKLGLTAGVELNLSIIKDFILIKKALSAKEFEKLSDNISESLRQETDSPIKIEKLF